MANTNAPFGFRPLGLYGGADPTMGLVTAKLAANTTNALYRGDPVVRASTGYVEAWSTAIAPGLMVGIFWGAQYLSTSLGRVTQNTFFPAGGADTAYDGTAYIIPCAGSPAPLFVVQAGGSASTGVVFADIGATISPAIGTGSIKGTYGMSGAYVDQTTIAATAKEFKIAGLWSDYAPSGTPGTAVGAYNLCVVYANVASETGVN